MLFIIYIIALSLFIGFTVFAPVFAGAILLVAVTFETVPIEIAGFTYSFADLSQIAFLVGAIIRWWLTKEDLDWDAAIPTFVISIAVLLSVPFSFSPVQSYFSAMILIANALTFYFVFWFIKTSQSDSIIPSIIPMLIFFILSVSIFQFLLWDTEQPFRLHAGLKNWNICAVILVGFLPFLIIQAHAMKLGFRSIYSIVSLLLLFVMIMGTRSRSGMILLLLAIGIVFLYGLFERKVAFILAASAVVAFISIFTMQMAGIYDFSGSLQSIISSPRVQERSQNALLAFITLTNHPFTGMGIGQWESYGIWAYPEVTFAIKSEYSSFMLLLAETGLAGGFASIYFFQRLFLQNTDNNHRPPILSAVHSSLWIWITASFLYSVHVHGFFWVWLGFLAGSCFIEYKPSHSQSLQNSSA